MSSMLLLSVSWVDRRRTDALRGVDFLGLLQTAQLGSGAVVVGDFVDEQWCCGWEVVLWLGSGAVAGQRCWGCVQRRSFPQLATCQAWLKPKEAKQRPCFWRSFWAAKGCHFAPSRTPGRLLGTFAGQATLSCDCRACLHRVTENDTP